MTGSPYSKLLKDVAEGRTSVAEAEIRLAELPFVDIGHTKLDTHRHLRQGYPEVILGAGKKPEQIVEITRESLRTGHDVLVTRLDAATGRLMARKFRRGKYSETSEEN